MLRLILTLAVDVAIAYLLVNFTKRLLILVPSGLVLGAIVPFAVNLALHLIFPDLISSNEAVLGAAASILWNPLVCLGAMWVYRRQGTASETPVDGVAVEKREAERLQRERNAELWKQ